MKKLMALMLCIIFVFCGCGKKQETAEGPEKTAKTSDGSKIVAEFENVESKAEKDIISDDTVLGDYTSEFLAEYVEGGSYYIVQNFIEDNEITQMEIAVKGDKAAEKTGTQVKVIDGDNLFYVIHDSKLVLTSPVAPTMKEGFTNFITVKTSAETKNALKNTGEEDIKGEKFAFEEFENEEGDIFRYYYDDKTLRYVKMTDEDGDEELIQVLELSTVVPEEIFRVPSEYIVKSLTDME